MESAQPQPAFPKPFVPAEMELGHGVKKKKINLFLTVCFVDELFFSWLHPLSQGFPRNQWGWVWTGRVIGCLAC